MVSLRAHVRRTVDHDRLPFRADCPICRTERLAGRLSSNVLVPRRVQAAVAAGVLVVSSLSPATALADGHGQPPDATIGGQTAGPDDEPDLGAATDALPDEGSASEDPGQPAATPPADQPPPSADDPLEEPEGTAPVTDPAAATEGATSVEEAELPHDAEPVEDAPTAAPDPSDAVPTPEPPPAAPSPSPTSAETPRTGTAPKARPRKKPKDLKREKRREAVSPPKRVPAAVPPTPAAEVPSAPPTGAATATPSPATRTRPPVAAVAASSVQRDEARPGDETHIVQRGESLWSIAADVLDGEASPARIAREVNRLWELNKSRIGTGDRDMLHAGTRLVLE